MELSRRAVLIGGGSSLAAPSSCVQAVLQISDRWEPLLDGMLIEKLENVTQRLTPPERRESVLTTNRPWEGPSSAYFSVVQFADRIRLYYRGFTPEDLSEQQVTCVAESLDGIHFDRPNLGLIEFQGSRENNIIWRGSESHNFAPFVDKNPLTPANAQFKALAGIKGKLYAYRSSDGIRWAKLQEEPVITKGAFDSLNLGFWDSHAKRYRCYSRFFADGVRAIQSCTSPDFVHWTEPTANRYSAGAPKEHFYTNATTPCPGAEHLLISFPKRFVPERTKREGYKEPGISDAVLMTSRDGLNWDRRFTEAWVRPGLDPQNWTQRSNMPAWGFAQTGAGELSFYISEHYEWPDHRIRRLVLPSLRFASLGANTAGGQWTTPAFRLAGTRLRLNYSTSAAGSIRVEVLDETGTRLLPLGPELFGDSLDEAYAFAGNGLQPHVGKVVRLRFTLKDADIYAIRIAN